MAETKLAMSLDALISQAGKNRDRKPSAPRQSGGQAPKSGPRKGLRKNKQNNNAPANGAQQQRPPKQQPQPQPQQQPQQQRQGQASQRNRKGGAANLGVRGGQVQKRSVIEVPAKALRMPQQPVPQPAPQRSKPFQQRQPAPEGKWQHDLYKDEYVPRRAPVSQVATMPPASTKLIIKNLYHQVSPDDLLELFTTCGTVKSYSVNYDSSGRSVGTGFVIFETRKEAEAAKKEYNNVKLDGQAMNIYFSEEVAGAGAPIKKLSSGITVQKAGTGGGAGGGGGAAPGGANGGQRLAAAAIRETAVASRGGRPGAMRGGQRLRSAVVGHAQLDADLQDYMQE